MASSQAWPVFRPDLPTVLVADIHTGMAPTTTVQESVPVTMPAEVLRYFNVKPGDRLSWSVEGNVTKARRTEISRKIIHGLAVAGL